MKTTPMDFCYFLQGFFEIEDPQTLNEIQTKLIKEKLAEVFQKVTPNKPAKWPAPPISKIQINSEEISWPEQRDYATYQPRKERLIC